MPYNHSLTILDILNSNNVIASRILRRHVESFYGKNFNNLYNAFNAVNGRILEDPGATVARFLTHSSHELEGGEVLLKVAECANTQKFKKALHNHGNDEIIHHKMFFAMASRVANEFSLGPVEFEKINTESTVKIFWIRKDGRDCTLQYFGLSLEIFL